MDFPPRGGSREGGDDDLEIDFEPLRAQRAEPPARRRRAQPRRRPVGRRARRRPAPEAPPRRRGPRSETLARVVWIAIPFAHAVLLRNLPLHGGALLIDVLVGTFVNDTFAYFGGRLFGRHPLAPQLSPNKTIEGLVIGVVGGTMGFWFAGLYQDWLPGIDALIMGMCIAIVAPIGDLFESMLKRDLDVKDTGNVFGPHGGLLDRL